MVDRFVLAAKLQEIRAKVGRVRAVGVPASGAALRGDEDLQDRLLRSLQIAIQAMVDAAAHVAADEGWGPADSMGALVGLLDREGIVPHEPALRLAALAGLRNVLVRRYGELDYDRIVRALPADLDDLVRFADIMDARFLAPDAPR